MWFCIVYHGSLHQYKKDTCEVFQDGDIPDVVVEWVHGVVTVALKQENTTDVKNSSVGCWCCNVRHSCTCSVPEGPWMPSCSPLLSGIGRGQRPGKERQRVIILKIRPLKTETDSQYLLSWTWTTILMWRWCWKAANQNPFSIRTFKQPVMSRYYELGWNIHFDLLPVCGSSSSNSTWSSSSEPAKNSPCVIVEGILLKRTHSQFFKSL